MLSPDPERRAMFEKCTQIDSKIIHYRQMAARITDQQTLDGIAALIKQMTADKASNAVSRRTKAASVGGVLS
jgi:beta-phosphoglucomutase-like phosphatase (HAD superfamily)